mgnify:CR=1 FL=1
MNQQEAIHAADQVAGVAYSGEPHPFVFSEILSIGALTMPEYLDRFREAPAMQLYGYICRLTNEPASRAWEDLPANMRCAFEVYCATYRVLMRFVRERELAARERVHGKLGGDRVVLVWHLKGERGLKCPDLSSRRCRVCGCTEADCRPCVKKTGSACHWVENDLCSACVTPAQAKAR